MKRKLTTASRVLATTLCLAAFGACDGGGKTEITGNLDAYTLGEVRTAYFDTGRFFFSQDPIPQIIISDYEWGCDALEAAADESLDDVLDKLTTTDPDMVVGMLYIMLMKVGAEGNDLYYTTPTDTGAYKVLDDVEDELVTGDHVAWFLASFGNMEDSVGVDDASDSGTAEITVLDLEEEIGGEFSFVFEDYEGGMEGVFHVEHCNFLVEED